ncbi:class I SAM-dependent methyltransferase [Streptomyces parvus]|uniref:class I SAM-dependent methyltransferase n=1 Tax=Streptomyces parvus TaxID=66428 RepID=UPI001238DA6B|nr:class I SAM-dependent methyltransferase [Streptomyces parvus]KAA6202451.1 class I SAM-dependent methyltransferase [Streptomyces parvus]GGS49329.1 methyltransferase [Streptomyces parvus]
MIDYSAEAEKYDASRGGEPRAEVAAEAVERLLPEGTRSLLDIACGTGIVTRRLRRPGRTVLGTDRSPGMLSLASERLPGHVVTGDATRLPFASGSLDAVVLIWLLHLLPEAAPVLSEAARVLRPGGVLITTVDKDEAYFGAPSDIAELTKPLRRAYEPRVTDQSDRVLRLAGRHGLGLIGETTFPGLGQGRGPRKWYDAIVADRIPWAKAGPPGEVAALCRDLRALPDQEGPRPDPLYRVVALRRPPV